ncbi:hypothetical protein [Cellulomonas rhizosphaerae]|uniref:Uncharacterized protein n=1 Tax=Cellulomonas rhizosphaerae TaxID=2293719 RepID=A0A413RPR6_9CELL|nr:hypothetical protein [Cellulomonas rhizosphaerae]RHA43996.1 hypothetical protein D1825_03485 [Cellulomonas rhizosphaerae]
MDQLVDGEALTKVLVLSLVFGAGVPAVFALGVRALAPVDGTTSVLRRSAAYLCFAVCAAAVVVGVAKLVIGSD